MGAVAHIEDYKKGVYFRNETRGDMSWNGYETNILLRNMGNNEDGIPHFSDVAMALGADDIHDSRGIATLDFDHDGDLDVAVSHNPGDIYKGVGVAPALYRNDVGHRKNWLAVKLVGTKVNRDAIGAEVLIQVAGQTQVRVLSAGSSYASQHTSRLYFGVAKATTIDSLTVRWPGGETESFQSMAVNQLVTITQSEGIQISDLPKQFVSSPLTAKQLPGNGGGR